MSKQSTGEQSQHKLAVWDAAECKNCGLGVGYWPRNPACPGAQSHTREGGEREQWIDECARRVERWLSVG